MTLLILSPEPSPSLRGLYGLYPLSSTRETPKNDNLEHLQVGCQISITCAMISAERAAVYELPFIECKTH